MDLLKQNAIPINLIEQALKIGEEKDSEIDSTR
jgi:hypothetical protein